MLGGDPPKAYLAGKEVAKLPWRPLLEVSLMLGLGNADTSPKQNLEDKIIKRCGYVVKGVNQAIYK